MKRSQVLKVTLIGAVFLAAVLALYLLFRKHEQNKKNDCEGRGRRWDSGLNECLPIGGSNPLNIDEFIWRTGFDTTTNREFLLKGEKLGKYAQSVKTMIDLLNRRNTPCKLEYLDQKGDTLYIRVLHDEYLTEQMGTTGAWCYLGETVVTLTENEEVNQVNIGMETGSHAAPGLYRRSDFEEMILDFDSLINEDMERRFDSIFFE
ncbi:MAG: hypothetical protein JW801_06200 [Bacteroidales bacterium]|nr:hypothetical protein [Bacteroidales bacterium]